MSCTYAAISGDQRNIKRAGGHGPIGSFLTVVAVIFVSDLTVVSLLSPAFARIPFLRGAFLQAMAVAVLAVPFLYKAVIQPFRDAIERAARKSRMVLDAAPEAIFEVASDGRIRSANVEAARLFGHTREELIGSKIEILLPQRFADTHVLKRERYTGNPHTRPMGSGIELVGLKKSGEEFPVEVSLSAIDEKGSPMVICILRDVRLQHAARNEIAQINERLTGSLAAHKALSETLDCLSEFGELLQSCTTRSEAYPIVTERCERLFPGQSGAVYLATASKTALERVSAWGPMPQPKPIVALQDCWALRRGKMHTSELSPCDGCMQRSDRRPEAGTVCIPMIAQGDMVGVLHLSARSSTNLSAKTDKPDPAVLAAVVERMGVAIANLRLREELRDQATRDSVTGLLNRRFLNEYLELELLRAMRTGQPLTVMMLDVDHFKRFNDTFGHKAGDLVLREVAGVLSAQTRSSDIVCRFGGEEMAVVCPETSSDQAIPRAEQIRKAVESLTVIDGGQLLGKVTISIGVASAPNHGYDMTQLLRTADEALYDAKKGGRNRVICAASGLSALIRAVSPPCRAGVHAELAVDCSPATCD